MLLRYSNLPFCSQCTRTSGTFQIRSLIIQSMSRICLEHSNSSCSQWTRYTWDLLSVCHEVNCILVMFLSFWASLISSWYPASLRPSRICSEILLNYPSILRYLWFSLKLRLDLTLQNVMIFPPLYVRLQIVKYAFVIGCQSNPQPKSWRRACCVLAMWCYFVEMLVCGVEDRVGGWGKRKARSKFPPATCIPDHLCQQRSD